MNFNPIIERELRIALRVRGAAKSRFTVAAYGVAAVACGLGIQWMTGDPSMGRTLHRWLFYGGMVLSIAPAFAITGGLFSEERRNQTLELLYLTGMSGGELFIGKLLGGLMVASCGLMALAPILAVPFLCGGISLSLFAATIASFPALLLFVMAVGSFSSVMSREEGTAQAIACVLIAVIAMSLPLPYSMGRLLSGAPPFSSGWLCLSPAYGPYLVWTGFKSPASLDEFWISTGICAAWVALFLAASAFMLRRNWRNDLEQNKGLVSKGFLDSLAGWVSAEKSARRRELVSKNPYQWLVALAFLLIGGIAILWLGCWAVWGHVWFTTFNLFLTALVLLLAMKWLEHYSASKRTAADRRDGALELLLTTPLDPLQIVEGQIAGVRMQFLRFRTALSLLFLAMMIGGYLCRDWTTGALVDYLLVWLVLLFSVLRNSQEQIPNVIWVALNSGKTMAGIGGPGANNPVHLINLYRVFSGLWVAGSIFGGLSRFPTGSALELCIVILCFFIWFMLACASRDSSEKNGGSMRNKLIQEMRSIAEEPVPDPKHPRFKTWNRMEHFWPEGTHARRVSSRTRLGQMYSPK